MCASYWLTGVNACRIRSLRDQEKTVIARELDLKTPRVVFMQPTHGLDAGAVFTDVYPFEAFIL